MAQRRRVKAYTDLGSLFLPPLPMATVLTDRADGTLWRLSHDNGTHIGLDDAAEGLTGEVIIYPALHGPTLTLRPTVRLLVRNGHLGYEDIPPPTGVSYPPPLFRRANKSKLFEIKAGTGWVSGDALSYEQTSLP